LHLAWLLAGTTVGVLFSQYEDKHAERLAALKSKQEAVLTQQRADAYAQIQTAEH
jgi:hypothetical protein